MSDIQNLTNVSESETGTTVDRLATLVSVILMNYKTESGNVSLATLCIILVPVVLKTTDRQSSRCRSGNISTFRLHLKDLFVAGAALSF